MANTQEPLLVLKRTLGLADYLMDDLFKKNGTPSVCVISKYLYSNLLNEYLEKLNKTQVIISKFQNINKESIGRLRNF